MRILSNLERGASPNIVQLSVSNNYVPWIQPSTERKKKHIYWISSLIFIPVSQQNDANSDLGPKL